jgi:hypothetical protein
VTVWWLLCGGTLILAAPAVAYARNRLVGEVDRLEATWQATMALGDHAADLRHAIGEARIDAAQRRVRLTARTASPSPNRLHADH